MYNIKPVSKEEEKATIIVNADPQTAAINAVADIYKESIRCFNDYAKCKEYEITKREQICASLSAVIKKINANKEIYLKTLETNFAERKMLYDKTDETIKKATETNNLEMLRTAYDYMLTVFREGNKIINFFE